MDLETRIAEALAKRDADRAQLAAEREEQRQEKITAFYENACETFGTELLGQLGMLIMAPLDDESPATARVYFRNLAYAFYKSRQAYTWGLARLDDRPAGDWRDRPQANVFASHHATLDERQRNLLLALVDLDAEPALAPLPGRPVDEPAEVEAEAPRSRSVEQVVAGALRDLIREEIAAARED